MNKSLIIGAGILAIAGISFFLVSNKPEEGVASPEPLVKTESKSRPESSARLREKPLASEAQPKNDEPTKRPIMPQRFEQKTAKLRNDPSAENFPHAAILNKKAQPETTYVNAVRMLLEDYANIVKKGLPTGLNVEITNALLGKNKAHLAVLDEGSERINEDGELTDQWGTPYLFHADSLIQVEVRSAGPDLQLFTGDDVVSESF